MYAKGIFREYREMKIKIPDGVILLLKILFFLGSGALATYTALSMFRAGNQLSVVIDGFFLLPVLYLFGISSTLLFAGPAGTALTDFMLWPRKYLKTPPIPLSRQQGLIAAGEHEKAECELLELRADHPASPEIALMLAELHGDAFGDIEAALADCEYYFKTRKFRYNPLNLELCLRRADWLCAAGKEDEAERLLEAESKRFFYSAPDRNGLKKRLSALRAGQEGTEE